MKYKNKKEFLRGIKTAVCMVLCLALVMTLLTPELLTQEAEAASVSSSEAADYETDEASYASDEVIIVYYDEPLEEDAASDAQSDEGEAQDASGDAASGEADAADEESVLDAAGVTEQEIISEDDADGTVVLAQLDGDVSVEEAIEVLEEDPAVDYVQPNYTYTLLTEEDDTDITEEAIDSDASEDLQYYLYSSSFTDAWESVTVDGAVTVAVIDTGCDLDHEDLIDTVNTAYAYDVTTGTLLTEADSDDAVGHGTYVCGVIAASAANGVGIAGASYNASLLPVKVFDSDNSCTTADLLAAYAYLDSLIDAGNVTNLRVINMSLGYYSDGTTSTDQALEAAISTMRSENGVLTICAGGNGTDGTASTQYCYPADFEACVSVTAVTADGENAAFSDYNDAKDIAAYGVNIYTTKNGGGYTTSSGTSLASPQVAAAAALLYAADSSLSADEVVSILLETTDEVTGNVHEETADVGILNAAAAVERVLSAGASDESADDEQQDASAQEDAQEIESEFESWRYSDGHLIQSPNTDDAPDDDADISLFSSTYSVWENSYGTSYYGIYAGDSTTKVAVSGVSRIVIDVSKWQGDIDWEEVAASGITAAIIRCGYGKDTTSYDDAYFIRNVEGALENGIEIGVYLYSYATTTTYAASEAAHVIRLLEEAGLDPEDLDLPVYLDMEDSDQAALSASELGDIAETFCDAIEAEGYTVGIYANLNWWTNYLTDDAFDNDDWYRWVARYPTSTSVTSSDVDDTSMWQFTCHGTVSGISGDVDVSFDYLGEGAYTLMSSVELKSVTLSSDLTAATLKWSTVSWADGYEVYRSVDGGAYSLIKTITDGSTAAYEDTGLSFNTTYSYKVRAYLETTSDEGETSYIYGDYTSEGSVTTSPGTVTLSSAASNSKGYILVSWKEVSDADGYIIYRSVDGGSYSKVQTITSGSKVSWTNLSVTPGKVYRYKIKAYITSGTTKVYSDAYSNVKTVTAAPAAVTISSAAVTTSGYIKVTWKKVSGADGYIIYRSVNGGSYSKVQTITSGSKVSWTNLSVSPGKVYRYKIRAYVTSGSSKVYSTAYSSVKKVTAKPAKVTISSITSTKSKSGTVKWKAVSNATGYQVAYRIKGTSKWYYTTVSTNKKVFTQLRNKKYYVKVRAYTKYNGTKYYGSWSSEKLMTVK